MTVDRPADPVSAALSEAAGAARLHREAMREERTCIDERDRLIAQAVRSGARLEEIAGAASISRAGVSLAARRTLAPRPGRGGPYVRRRGAKRAVDAVREAARDLNDARRGSADAKSRRDRAIRVAIARGSGVRTTAQRVGLAPGAVSLIARTTEGPASTDGP
jgi:hypothetical protein